MNKEELLECLKSLSTTNNKRDGIDIKKEEAQLIIEIINKYKEVLDKIKEYVLEASKETLNNGRIFYNGTPAQTILELLEEIE